jgi:hypothetical protein
VVVAQTEDVRLRVAEEENFTGADDYVVVVDDDADADADVDC